MVDVESEAVLGLAGCMHTSRSERERSAWVLDGRLVLNTPEYVFPVLL